MDDETLDNLFAFGVGRRTDEEWALFRLYVERWQQEREDAHAASLARIRKKYEGTGILWQPPLPPNRLTPMTMAWMEEVAKTKTDEAFQERKELMARIEELEASGGLTPGSAPGFDDDDDDDWNSPKVELCPTCGKRTTHSRSAMGRLLCDSCGLSERESIEVRGSTPTALNCPICGQQTYLPAPREPDILYCPCCNRTQAKAEEWVETHRVVLRATPKPRSPQTRSILSRLLSFLGEGQDSAVVDLLAAAENIRSDLAIHSTVTNRVIDALVQSVKQWSSQRINEYRTGLRTGNIRDPETAVYNHLVTTTADQLASGELSLYPGCLSLEGHAVYDLFLLALASLVARGTFSNEWASEHWRKPVAEAIRTGG